MLCNYSICLLQGGGEGKEKRSATSRSQKPEAIACMQRRGGPALILSHMDPRDHRANLPASVVDLNPKEVTIRAEPKCCTQTVFQCKKTVTGVSKYSMKHPIFAMKFHSVTQLFGNLFFKKSFLYFHSCSTSEFLLNQAYVSCRIPPTPHIYNSAPHFGSVLKLSKLYF